MKVERSLCIILSLFMAEALGNKPRLKVEVRDGSFSNIEGLEPCISWETSGQSGDYDLECGIDITARPTYDLASLPKSIWGKVKREWKGWDLMARTELEAEVPNLAKIEFEADSDEDDLNLKVSGKAGKEIVLSKIEATKGFKSGDTRVTVNPRYNLDEEDGDVILGWENDKTLVEVIADRHDQSVKVSQQLDDDNRVAPMYASNGTFAVEWERQLGDDNSVLTKVTPNEKVEVKWNDHLWTANVEIPLEGTKLGGPSVTIKREVNF